MTLELNEDGSIRLRLSTGSGSGGGYAGNHNALSGRDAPACHPIGAIDGLAGILETLRSAVAGSAPIADLESLAADLRTLSVQFSAEDDLLAGRITAVEEAIAGGLAYDDTELRGLIAALDAEVGTKSGTVIDGVLTDLVIETTGPAGEVAVTYATNASLVEVSRRLDSEAEARFHAIQDVRADMASADSTVLDAAKAYADGRVSTVLIPKGSITNAALAALTDMVLGDMWDVVDDGAFPAGANVWWTGNHWDEFAARIDMSRYDAHLASRDNPHGVTLEQVATAPQIAAMDSGITAGRLAVIDSAVAKVSTIEEGAERNAVDGAVSGGAMLPQDAARNVVMDGIVHVGPEPTQNCLIWFEVH